MTSTQSAGPRGGVSPYPEEPAPPVEKPGAGAGEPRPEPAAGEPTQAERPSTGHLVAEVATDVSALVRYEIALARAELREEAKKAGRSAGMFAGAGGAGYFSLIFLLLAAMFGLAAVIPTGWAALIVAVVLLSAAAVLAVVGRSTARSVHPAPAQTVETIREDIRWAQHLRG